MTPTDRAARIVNLIANEIPVLTANRKRLLHKEISTQIAEAEREIVFQHQQDMDGDCFTSVQVALAKEQGRAEGFRAGQEEILKSIALHNNLPFTNETVFYGLYQQGFRSAREKAKALAESCIQTCARDHEYTAQEIAQRIGEMEVL